MPELPEVETIVTRLRTVLPGKQITAIQVIHPKSWRGATEKVVGQPIVSISRRAKMICIKLPEGINILGHLKMTGQLIYRDQDIQLGGGHPTADWVQQLPGKHTRVIVSFENGAQLFFNDQRLFGWLRVMSDDQVAAEWASLGPDVVDSEFTLQYLEQKLKNKQVPIKVAIMDGLIVGGLGNIYACDALNLARLHPSRSSASLNQDELQRLWQAAREVIELGIAHQGTTFDGSYVTVEGLAGSYQTIARVYGREGESCLGCGGLIKKKKLGGRGTYFCPSCQV